MPKLANLMPKVIGELGKRQDKYIILTADEYGIIGLSQEAA